MAGLTIADLLDEEELVFEPVDAPFDVEAVAARLATLGFPFRDEHEPAVFVIAASDEVRQKVQAARRKAPDQGYPYVLLVEVKPWKIVMSPAGQHEYGDLSREIIEWLLETRQCKVTNDRGTDVTAALAEVIRKP